MDLRKDTEESEDFEEGRMDVSDGPEGVEAPLDETDPSETDPSENSFPPSRPIAEDTGGLNFALSEEDMAKLQHHANQDLSSSLSSSSNSKKITLNIPHEATSTSLLETPSAAAATPQSTSIPLVTPIFACDPDTRIIHGQLQHSEISLLLFSIREPSSNHFFHAGRPVRPAIHGEASGAGEETAGARGLCQLHQLLVAGGHSSLWQRRPPRGALGLEEGTGVDQV